MLRKYFGLQVSQLVTPSGPDQVDAYKIPQTLDPINRILYTYMDPLGTFGYERRI